MDSTKQNEQRDMVGSFTTGSDTVFEFVCKPCERDDQLEEGVGYCVECGEYLCTTCFNCHKKLLVSRDHTLLDKVNMPKDVSSPTPPALPPKPKKLVEPSNDLDTDSKLTQKCPRHEREVTKFHCNEHVKLACSVCLSMDHRTCKDVSYIPEVSQGILTSKEFQRVFDELKRLKALLGYEYHRVFNNEKRIDEIHKSVLGDIQDFKAELIQIIDKLYKDIETDLITLKQAQIACTTTWIKRYNGVMPEIERTIRKFEPNPGKVECNQLYIDMKNAKTEMPNLQNKIKRLSNDNVIAEYKFEKKSAILESLKAMNELGKILKKQSLTDVSVKLLHEINVKTTNDTDDCNINSALILPTGDLALSDHHNKSVKVIAPSQNKVGAQIVLESEPFDLTLVGEDQLAVALPNDDKIQILKFSDSDLTTVRSFDTAETCVGIAYHDNKLITACQDPGCVVIMDMNGKKLQTLDKDSFGKQLCSKPRTVSLSMDGGVIYVTEWDTNKVQVINLDGEPIIEYQHDNLKKPLGLDFGIDGTVYLTYGDSHALHQASPTFTQENILLKEKDGLRFPWAIALDRNKDLLYVGSVSKSPALRNKMSVYSLIYNWK